MFLLLHFPRRHKTIWCRVRRLGCVRVQRACGYARLRDLRVSRCDRYVAYTVALKGDDDHGLYVLDTSCGLRVRQPSHPPPQPCLLGCR